MQSLTKMRPLCTLPEELLTRYPSFIQESKPDISDNEIQETENITRERQKDILKIRHQNKSKQLACSTSLEMIAL